MLGVNSAVGCPITDKAGSAQIVAHGLREGRSGKADY